MKIFGRVMLVTLYVGAGFMAGMLVDGSDFLMGFIQGRLYALYVLIYTGAAFMGGLWFGQRWERSWQSEKEEPVELLEGALSDAGVESYKEEGVREPSELRR